MKKHANKEIDELIKFTEENPFGSRVMINKGPLGAIDIRLICGNKYYLFRDYDQETNKRLEQISRTIRKMDIEKGEFQMAPKRRSTKDS